MTFNPDIHHRKSIRLRGYDYSQAGMYFVTICTQDRMCLFGDITDGEIRMNEYGDIAWAAWRDLPNHYAHIELDEFIVMPNHVHWIVRIVDAVGAGLKPARTEPARTDPAPTKHGLPEIVRAFKTYSARRINERRRMSGVSVWQRNYYEHIIRDEAAHLKIAEYIQTNPQRWQEDTYYV